MRQYAAALLLVCWAARMTDAKPPAYRKCVDLLCDERMVVDVAAGTMSALIAKNDDTWQDMGTLFSTPEDGQVFKIAGNRITLTSNDNTREFISFHVLYDDKGGAVNVHFEYGEKIDLVGSWCLPLPNHPPFVGETCTRGAVKLGTKIGTRTAYRVSVTTDTTTQDSGEMRDPNSRVCFWATDVFTNVTNPATNRNVTGARRCVYLRTIPPTDFPYIYPKIGSDPPKSADNIVAFVGNGEVPTADQGYELRLEVRAKSVVANLKVDIESSTYGGRVFAELPGQRWAGETTCVVTGDSHGPCDEWTRTLIYRPTAVQRDKDFQINFQTVTRFPEDNLFSDPPYAGVACAGEMGTCKNGTDVANFMLNTNGATVSVEEWTPRYRYSREDHQKIMDELEEGTHMGQKLQRQFGVFLNPPVYASPVMKCTDPLPPDVDYPATCVRDPHPAYVNCPMKSFGVVAEMACEKENPRVKLPAECESESINAATGGLQFSIASARSVSGSDALSMGLKLSELLFIAEPVVVVGSDNTAGAIGDNNTAGVEVQYLAHVAVMWTPPLEAMGHIFNVCIDVKGPKGFATRCVPVEVKRCFYCTVQSETLHTIAAKFQTEWMQLWSANHEKMEEVLDVDSVGTYPWKDTKNPNNIKPGTLIRLGPVYHSPVVTEVGWLLEEFRTTRESLMLANPNIVHGATHIQADQSVCVLPDICTQVREEWLRPKSKDSFFP